MPFLLPKRFRGAWRRYLFLGGAMGVTFVAAVVVYGNSRFDAASKGRLFTDLEAAPARRVALVLGCAKSLSDGRDNLFFRHRIEAAAALYQAGKADYLLVSGDNHRVGYDEPTDMKNALVELGVPADRVYCDYAGFSTFDSLVRAKSVFGLAEVTVVSQAFHNRRALYIAKSLGLDAVGFNASDVAALSSVRTNAREQLAIAKTVFDVEVWGRRPRFLGEPILIGAADARRTQPEVR